MIRINVKQDGISTEHEVFTHWDDVPIGLYIDYIEKYEGKTTNIKDLVVQRELLFMFSTIKPEYKFNFPAFEVKSYFRNCTMPLLNSPLPTGEAASFLFNDERYTAPTPKTIQFGGDIPMHEMTVEEGLESMRLLEFAAKAKKGDITILPDVLAILFRPEGEIFNEQTSIERAKLFRQQLPVTIALPSYFFLCGWFNSFMPNILTYLAKMEAQKSQEMQKSQTFIRRIWRGLRSMGGLLNTRRTILSS